MKEIALSKPNLNPEIIKNLSECIETGWVSTGGRFIEEFENKVADYVKSPDVVSCQSGTAGLHLALKIMGVGRGDEVIVPTLTFIAAVNPIRYLDASPVFMDCDESFCLDPTKLEDFCRDECHIIDGNRLINNTSGKQIKAIVVVHVFGNMADMIEIMDIAKRYHLKVVEDATEAIGTYYMRGRYEGIYAGTIGDIGVYSFNANKIITTGGGGMIVSMDQDLLNEARYLSTTAKDDALYFVHNEVGYNYRMLNIQAALGVSQIDELEKFIETKIDNYNHYKRVLGDKLLDFRNDTRANHWFYSFKTDNRDELLMYLIDNGVQARPLWKLNHEQEPYKAFQTYKISKAYEFEKSILNIPCSSDLTHDEIDFVCGLISS